MEPLTALLIVFAAWALVKSAQAARMNGQPGDDSIAGQSAGYSAQPDGSEYHAPLINDDVSQQPTGGGWVMDIIQFIKQQEGLKLKASPDEGTDSIGYGHDLLPGESYPNGISQAQADTLLQADVSSAQASVHALVKVPLTQGQQDALTDFVYNDGSGALQKSTLLQLLNQGDYEAAGQELLRWVFAGGQVNSDLQARRQADLEMWNG